MTEQATQFVYRCITMTNVIAFDAEDAKSKTGADIVTKICQHPLPTLADIKKRWSKAVKSREGLAEIQEWMIAAVRLGMIDSVKFDEMEKAVQGAMDALGTKEVEE